MSNKVERIFIFWKYSANSACEVIDYLASDSFEVHQAEIKAISLLSEGAAIVKIVKGIELDIGFKEF